MIHRIRRRKQISGILGISLCLSLLLTGCSSEASTVGYAKEKKQADAKTTHTSLVGAFDSADRALITALDTENEEITLMNLESGKQYGLTYSGTSYIMDKYGSSMSARQLKQGQIVDVTFLKSTRTINQLQVAEDAWRYEQVSKYDLNGPNETATIGNAVYSVGENTKVFSNGRQGELMDVVAGDVLTISGVGHEIYSVMVERGHGYVRLKNDAGLIGGWLGIGNEIITKVTSENMLFPVPEGDYTLCLRTATDTIYQDIVIERNQEVILDCGKIKPKEDKDGYVNFQIQPGQAKLIIDGEEQATHELVKLSYGVHEIQVEAEGYQRLLKHIVVGTKLSEITILLEKSAEKQEIEDDEEGMNEDETERQPNSFFGDEVSLPDTKQTVSENKVSQNSASTSANAVIHAVTSNKVYIDEPKQVEIFLDGNYIGLAPTVFAKTTGKHTLTLRKPGYITRSYTIVLHDDGEDITYSFSGLEPEEQAKEKEDRISVKEIVVEPEKTEGTTLTEEAKPEGETTSTENTKPEEEITSTEDTKPEGETTSTENTKPEGETNSTENTKPEEKKPEEENPVEEPEKVQNNSSEETNSAENARKNG